MKYYQINTLRPLIMSMRGDVDKKKIVEMAELKTVPYFIGLNRLV